MGKVNEDIKYITGLKGAGCIMVVLIHFCAAFFPCLYLGDSTFKKLPFEELISHSPLYFFYNGSFAVYIFWTVSAFLISINWFHKGDISEMARKVIKKYIRFLGPVFVSCLFSYILMKGRFLFNLPVSALTESNWLAMFFIDEPDVKSFLKCIFLDTYFSGSVLLYNPVLWSMKIEFLGSLFTVFFLVLYGNVRGKYCILCITFVYFIAIDPRYVCFIIGILCGEFYVKKGKANKGWTNVFCIVAAVLGGGYPGFYPEKGIYAWIPIILFGKLDTRIIIYCFAAGCALVAVINCSVLNRFFASKQLENLGEKSLYIYLFHLPIECSAGCFVFYKIYMLVENYVFASGIALVVIISMSIIIARWFGKVFVPVWDKIVKSVVGFLI